MTSYDINNVEDKEIVVYISPNGYGRKVFELQKRIDKAIEYIDRRDLDYGSEEHEYLFNILRGEDND